MFKIYNDTIIYILCPAKIVTGGPEAVHQLVHKLHSYGHGAKIVPFPRVPNPSLLQYRNYRVDFADAIDDQEKNILITTEVNPRALDEFNFIQKGIWWLSVDFHEKLTQKFDFHAENSKNILHLAQSAYACSFLKERGIESVYPLTDYLNEVYLRPRVFKGKTNRILYTPVKGAEVVVQRLMEADAALQWLALTGMTRKKHAQTIRQGKVYVDFGSHPGKDRQPREAAVNGCCVIVGLSGSARFEDDMPIPSHYKFHLGGEDDDAILNTIRSCLLDYENRINDFAAYADHVRHDEQRFEKEVLAIFGLKKPCHHRRLLTNCANVLTFAKENDPLTVSRALLNEFSPPVVTDYAKSAYTFFRSWTAAGGK